MKISELSLDQLKEAPWNPNHMDRDMMGRLRESIRRYGIAAPLVVRPIERDTYQVLSGNQRFRVLRSMGFETAPCVVVDVNDADAMLLAQAMNDLHGDDDLGLKGALFEKVLATVSEDRVLSLLPETVESLRVWTTISQGDMAQHLIAWQKAQAARLKHLQIQLTDRQLETVEEAISAVIPQAVNVNNSNPNNRGTAIYQICRFYLERRHLG